MFFIEGADFAVSMPCQGFETRSVSEPASETVVRGPKEGFIESINTNRSLIRRKIKNEKLIFEEMQIGTHTRTIINIARNNFV